MTRIARLSTLLIALLLAAGVTGCGTAEQESEEPSPSDAASLYLEAMRGNVSGLKEQNPDTEITEEGVFGSVNSGLLETWGVSATAEQEAQLTEAMLAGLSKVEFTVGDEKVDGESATVTVALRGIDMSSSLDTQFETIGGQITEDTEDKTVIAILDKAWREAPLVPEATNVDMPFTAVSDGRWIADPQGAAALSAVYVEF
jgi:hypothetical protein